MYVEDIRSRSSRPDAKILCPSPCSYLDDCFNSAFDSHLATANLGGLSCECILCAQITEKCLFIGDCLLLSSCFLHHHLLPAVCAKPCKSTPASPCARRKLFPSISSTPLKKTPDLLFNNVSLPVPIHAIIRSLLHLRCTLLLIQRRQLLAWMLGLPQAPTSPRLMIAWYALAHTELPHLRTPARRITKLRPCTG